MHLLPQAFDFKWIPANEFFPHLIGTCNHRFCAGNHLTPASDTFIRQYFDKNPTRLDLINFNIRNLQFYCSPFKLQQQQVTLGHSFHSEHPWLRSHA